MPQKIGDPTGSLSKFHSLQTISSVVISLRAEPEEMNYVLGFHEINLLLSLRHCLVHVNHTNKESRSIRK